ncbi:Protein of unknown function [Pyronema omphalodes CBS 100304]|uniref:Uncharacterized protein n=1 Tax=Pyronema omphalodes (strain CBS 100304) TaxID=1076935 RepID=U4L176_PYROM|nr:Protein of unknown function [Pyronema omphalodes CBS 100304]
MHSFYDSSSSTCSNYTPSIASSTWTAWNDIPPPAPLKVTKSPKPETLQSRLSSRSLGPRSPGPRSPSQGSHKVPQAPPIRIPRNPTVPERGSSSRPRAISGPDVSGDPRIHNLRGSERTGSRSPAVSSTRSRNPNYPGKPKGNDELLTAYISHTLVLPCRDSSIHPALRPIGEEPNSRTTQISTRIPPPRERNIPPVNSFLPAHGIHPFYALPIPQRHACPTRSPKLSSNLEELWKTAEGAASTPALFSLSIHNVYSSLYFGTQKAPLYTFTGQTLLRENPRTRRGKKVFDISIAGNGKSVKIGRWRMKSMEGASETDWELRAPKPTKSTGSTSTVNSTRSLQSPQIGQEPLFVSLRDRIARVVNCDNQVLVELDTGRRFLKVDTRISGVAGSDVIDAAVAAVIARVVLEGRRRSRSSSLMNWSWQSNRPRRYSGDDLLIEERGGRDLCMLPVRGAWMVVYFLAMLGWEIGKAVVESCRPMPDRRKGDNGRNREKRGEEVKVKVNRGEGPRI